MNALLFSGICKIRYQQCLFPFWLCGIQCRQCSPLFWHLQNSVPERASYGTEYACRAKKGFLRYATHFLKPSVLKIGFSGTEGIFGTGNALLRYATRFQRRKTADSADCEQPSVHRTHFQRRRTADSDTRPLNYPVRPYPSAPPHLKYGLNY